MFNGEIRLDFGLSISIKLGNTARDWIAVDILLGGFDEGVDIADFSFDFGVIGILLGSGTVVSGSGALEIAESLGESMIATAQDPVDDFAFGHGVEIVGGEMILGNHGTENIGDELETGASSGILVTFAKREIAGGEFGGEFGVFEAKFVETSFIAQDDNIVVEAFDVGEIPGVIEEITIAKGIFEAIGGEARNVIIGDREEFVIGDFARENTIFFELASDDAGIADDFAGASLNGLLVFGIAVEIINGMFKAGAGDIVEETSKSLDFIMSEVPNDEGDTNAMGKDGVEILEIIDGAIIHGGHTDVF